MASERDVKGRFAEGNHSGGMRRRIEILEQERAELRRRLRVAREALAEMIEEAGTDAGIYPPYVVAREALRQLDSEVGAYTERDK